MGAQAVVWHHGYVVEDGTPFPLRHRLSEHARRIPELSSRALGLSKQQSELGQAIHELAHGVLWLAHGVHVVSVGVGVGRGGLAECDQPRDADQRLGWAIGVAAGERAEDRWLRESGLWTEDLAAMAEIAARTDRANILAADPQPRPGFGDGGEADYSEFHDLADQALDVHWDRISTVLPLLIMEGQMTGDQLASLVDLPNP